MSDFFEIDYGNGVTEKPKGIKEVTVERAKEQVQQAKKNGLEEMRKFDEAYKVFKKSTEDLILFKDANEQIEAAVDIMVESVLRPIILGKNIQGMPEKAYNEIRKDIFKTLIQHYDRK